MAHGVSMVSYLYMNATDVSRVARTTKAYQGKVNESKNKRVIERSVGIKNDDQEPSKLVCHVMLMQKWRSETRLRACFRRFTKKVQGNWDDGGVTRSAKLSQVRK